MACVMRYSFDQVLLAASSTAPAYASIASLMRFCVSGRFRNRFPVALAIAFGSDAAAGPCPVSPLRGLKPPDWLLPVSQPTGNRCRPLAFPQLSFVQGAAGGRLSQRLSAWLWRDRRSCNATSPDRAPLLSRSSLQAMP